jgi:hypothetical protein
MAKYLKKHTVIYRFKFDVLEQNQNMSLDNVEKQELWEIYLYSMMKNNFISPHQAKTWKYPTKELK